MSDEEKNLTINNDNDKTEVAKVDEAADVAEVADVPGTAEIAEVTDNGSDVAESQLPADSSREEVTVNLEGDDKPSAPASSKKNPGLALVILGVFVVLLAIAATIFHSVGGTDAIISPLTIHGKKISSADFSFMYHYTMIEEGVDLFAADTPKLLSSPYNDDERYNTYKDYFLDYTAQRMQTVEILYDDATSKGYNIENRHYERAEAYVSWIKDKADELGVTLDTYIKGVYGNQVDEQVVVNYLAKKYFTDDYADGAKLEELSATEDQALEAYNNDPNTYDVVDYKLLRIAYEQREQAYVDTANLHAEQIIEAMAGDASQFETCAAKYFSGEAKNVLEQPDSTLQKNCRYNDFTHADFRNWLFGVDRKPGDSTIFSDSDGFPIIIVFVQRQRMSDNLRDVHIAHVSSIQGEEGNVFEKSQTLAQEIYEKVKKEGADSFSEVENIYNTQVLEGRLVVTHSQMTFRDQYSSDINAWIFDESRNPGDTTLLDMDGDFYILHFVSKSDKPEWYDRVNSFIRMNNYSAFISEKSAEYTYEFDENGLTSIKDVP